MCVIGHDDITKDHYPGRSSCFIKGFADNLFNRVFLKDRQAVMRDRGKIISRVISRDLEHCGRGGGTAANVFRPLSEKHSFSANRAAQPRECFGMTCLTTN